MSLARRFYNMLTDVLYETQDLKAGASLLQTDRVMAARFGLSESTTRNWRRGKHSHIAPTTASTVIHICRHIAPHRVSDLEFIDRLSRGVHEIRAAAEALVLELESIVLADGSTWHIYSGPLKIAFDTSMDAQTRRQLLRRSSMVVERVFEMGIDKADVPCISELIRYSTHGWYVDGLYRTRVTGLSSATTGIYDGYLGALEEALYIGDGCAIPCLISGDVERARSFTRRALQLLETVTSADEKQAAIRVEDAHIMIRTIEAMIACYGRSELDDAVVAQFLAHYGGDAGAENDWIEGTRQEALGYAELTRRADYAKAAYHFGRSGFFLDQWLVQFGIPFSSTSSHSLSGYALLLGYGPTLEVKSQISDGLLRTIDLGIVSHEVRARLCQARYYAHLGNGGMADFHLQRTQDLVQRHNLQKWYDMLNQMIAP